MMFEVPAWVRNIGGHQSSQQHSTGRCASASAVPWTLLLQEETEQPCPLCRSGSEPCQSCLEAKEETLRPK